MNLKSVLYTHGCWYGVFCNMAKEKVLYSGKYGYYVICEWWYVNVSVPIHMYLHSNVLSVLCTRFIVYNVLAKVLLAYTSILLLLRAVNDTISISTSMHGNFFSYFLNIYFLL